MTTMAIVRAKNFKGYSSKPDELINNPELGSKCQDMIINKGDLCNYPFTNNVISLVGVEISDTAIILGEVDGTFFALYINPEDNFKILDLDGVLDTVVLKDSTPNFSSVVRNIGIELRKDKVDIGNFVSSSVATYASWIKSGKWYYLHGDTGNEAYSEATTRAPKGRMIRLYVDKEDGIFKVGAGLIGIEAPLFVAFNEDAVPPGFVTYHMLIQGTYDFAFSFVLDPTPIPRDIVSASSLVNQSILSENGVESNAIELRDVTIDSSNDKVPYFHIYFPIGSDLTLPSTYFGGVSNNVKVNVFIRDPSSGQTVYRYLTTASLTDFVTEYDGDFAGLRRASFFAGQEVTPLDLNVSHNPHFSGRSVPWTCNHIAEFKGRYYRDTINQFYHTRSGTDGNTVETIKSQENSIQVSPSFNEEFIGSGLAITDLYRAQTVATRHINYTDEKLAFPAGEGPTTGLIEYLGQLIIFKRTETYVLTGDVEGLLDGTSELRSLWSKLGCVIEKTIGYIVINDILYFVAQDGIYAFTGQGRPFKISGLIEEDLLAEPYYKNITLTDYNRYNIMVLSFPELTRNTYMYHYKIESKESGSPPYTAWTTGTNNGAVLQDHDLRYWEHDHNLLKLLKSINEPVASSSNLKAPEFDTGMLTLGDDVRNKQWKEWTLETLTEFITSSNDYTVKFDTENSNDVVSKSSQIIKRQHVGIYSAMLQMNFTMLSKFKNRTPFRINGFSITGEMRGLR